MRRWIIILIFMLIPALSGCKYENDDANLEYGGIVDKEDEEEKVIAIENTFANVGNNTTNSDNAREHLFITDEPTMDIDSIQQINQNANDDEDQPNSIRDKVVISVKDVTSRTIKIGIDNVSDEAISIDSIYFKEYLSGQWSKKVSDVAVDLPGYGFTPGYGEIEFDFGIIYGELSGEYICVVEMEGVLWESRFEIN